jgi:hypothetical protein
LTGKRHVKRVHDLLEFSRKVRASEVVKETYWKT